jgi:hypothetical protein
MNALKSPITLGNKGISASVPKSESFAWQESMHQNGRLPLVQLCSPFLHTTITTPKNLRPSAAAPIDMRLPIIWTYMFAATASAKWWTKEEPSCAVITGSSEGIAYRYYAHSHYAQPCVSSEMVRPIKLSIDHSMKKLDLDCLPDSTCMPVDYDDEWNHGRWKGYLLYGPKGKVNLAKYCGPSLEYELKPSCSKSSALEDEL